MSGLFERIQCLSDRFFEHHGADADCIFRALRLAEDRRARWHVGVDLISIGRALLAGIGTGRVRGLSTIEQQLVRALRPRTLSPLRSKPLELVLATAIGVRFKKETIWAAYLEAAYFGADWDTFRDVRHAFAPNLLPLTFEEACSIVACLKYPQPEGSNAAWKEKHAARVRHLRLRTSC